LSEAIFVGISAGYWLVVLFYDNFYAKFWQGVFPVDRTNEAGKVIEGIPDYWLLIGGALGFLMLMRLVPKVGWISRWPLAFIVGATSGFWLMNYFTSNVMVQVQGTIQPLFSTAFGAGFDAGWLPIVSNIVVLVGTFTGLVYFYFSKEHTGSFGTTAKIGVFFLMITFGASFGYTVMSRMSLLIGRMDFLFNEWLGMIS
jgi:hypothetical protein